MRHPFAQCPWRRRARRTLAASLDAVLQGEGASSAVGDGAGQEASHDVRVRGCAGKYTLKYLRLLGRLRGKYAPNRKGRLQVSKLKKRLHEKYNSELKQRLKEECEKEDELKGSLREKCEKEEELQDTLREM